MNILSFFRSRSRPTAPQAKERLQILLAHERASMRQPDYLPRLYRDIVDVVGRYVEIDTDKVQVQLQTVGTVSKLELNIELPNGASVAHRAAV